MTATDKIDQALAECANEPVHIPGTIQPAGGLLAYGRLSGRITHISDNCPELLKRSPEDLLDAPARDLFGPTIWHDLQNAASLADFATKRRYIGVLDIEAANYDLHAFASDDAVVIEIELASTQALLAPEIMSGVAQLMERISAADNEASLLEMTVQLLRTVTGYDRAMVYRFDADFNGEVVAESRKSRLEPFLGLCFPSWDIPTQARAIMHKLPLRMICDVDQKPVPITAADSQSPPLDITLANLRGVSAVHIQYLRNMGTAATMTLSLVVEGRLWGIVSFHHMRTRVPSVEARLICEAFLPYLQARLAMMMNRSELRLVDQIETLRSEIREGLDTALTLQGTLNDVGPALLESFSAQGVSVRSGEQRETFGLELDEAIEDRLITLANDQEDKLITLDCLRDSIQEYQGQIAGVLALALPGDHALLIMREARARQVRWAGAPDKTIEVTDGMARLNPRRSFALYIEETAHRSDVWLGRDIGLARALGQTIVQSSGRRSIIQANIRQQALMIDELNHRVRNILSLIRSVSRQARRHQASLDSYSDALEKRINALALAHDIGAGRAVDAISIKELIMLEAEPYIADNRDSLRVTGSDRLIKADQGPIFALVIHELMTNANKYGALRHGEGCVEVYLVPEDDGLSITWIERGGPKVLPPTARGFGSTLIEQAVPYELGGRSKLHFEADGVRAEFWLPKQVFDDEGVSASLDKRLQANQGNGGPGLGKIISGTALIIEDNYMIATDMSAVMHSIGFEDVEIVSNIDDAHDYLVDQKPTLAVLDIHLGVGGETSLGFAGRLLEDSIPFMFVTGYGERLRLPASLGQIQVLTKPVSTTDLRQALTRLLPQ